MKLKQLFNRDAINGMIEASPFVPVAALAGYVISGMASGLSSNPALVVASSVAVGLAGAWTVAANNQDSLSPIKNMIEDFNHPRADHSWIMPNALPSLGFFAGALLPTLHFF